VPLHRRPISPHPVAASRSTCWSSLASTLISRNSTSSPLPLLVLLIFGIGDFFPSIFFFYYLLLLSLCFLLNPNLWGFRLFVCVGDISSVILILSLLGFLGNWFRFEFLGFSYSQWFYPSYCAAAFIGSIRK